MKNTAALTCKIKLQMKHCRRCSREKTVILSQFYFSFISCCASRFSLCRTSKPLQTQDNMKNYWSKFTKWVFRHHGWLADRSSDRERSVTDRQQYARFIALVASTSELHLRRLATSNWIKTGKFDHVFFQPHPHSRVGLRINLYVRFRVLPQLPSAVMS